MIIHLMMRFEAVGDVMFFLNCMH